MKTLLLILLTTMTASAQLTVRNPFLVDTMFRPAAAAGGTSADAFTNIAGLKMWFAGRKLTGTNSGDSISQLVDFSGNNLHAYTRGGSNPPKLTNSAINSLAAFDMAPAASAHAWALSNALSGMTAGTVFVVLKTFVDPPASGDPGGLWGLGSPLNMYYVWTTGVIYDDFGSDTRKTTVDPTPALTSWRLYCASSSANAWTNYLDTTAIYGTGANTVAWPTAPSLGFTASGPSYFGGLIAEFILFDTMLSASDRATVEQALKTTYGAALSY